MRTIPDRRVIGALGIAYRERDVSHIIAVEADVPGDRMIGCECRCQHQSNIVLLKHNRYAVTYSGFESCKSNWFEAIHVAVEVRGLKCIAYIKLEVVETSQQYRFRFLQVN